MKIFEVDIELKTAVELDIRFGARFRSIQACKNWIRKHEQKHNHIYRYLIREFYI